MNREIITLPKERWKGVPIPLVTRSDSYYDVEITPMNQEGCTIHLETQSCNTNAIGFYLHQGFELIGFDKCCYTNKDIERREVRINLGYFFAMNGRWE